ncbi:MAG: CHAD domain-containing protein [Sphingomicrobium sp.]
MIKPIRAMPTTRELELKLMIAPEDAKRLRLGGPLAAQPASREHQESIYFDTAEYELRKAGLSLRVRRSGDHLIQTVKSRANGAGLFERDEWEMPVRAMKPELDCKSSGPISSLSGNAGKLDPIACIEIDRTSWRIAGKCDLVEISLDRGVIRAGPSTAKISGLELELKHGSEEVLFDLCEALSKRVPLRLDVRSKAELAEALAEGWLGKPTKAGRVDVGRGMTVGQGFTLIVLSCLRHLRLNEDLFVDRRDPEALHQVRVATRRLLSAFQLFRPIVDGKRYRKLTRELHWFSSSFGEVRNLDTFIDMAEGEGPRIDRLRKVRERAYDRLIALLQTPKLPRLMIAMLRWLFIGRWRGRSDASSPLASFLAWRLDKSWARISDLGPKLRAMSGKERHRFRLRVKRFRYALDFTRGLHRAKKLERKPFRRALAGLQDRLGLLNDRRAAEPLSVRWRCHVPSLDDWNAEADLLTRAEQDFKELLAIGPYWRGTNPRRRAAAGARRRASAAPPGAFRTRAPRSGGSARG